MAKAIVTEAIECCPYCGSENAYPNWNAEKDGYIVTCKECGKKIFLCDECLHAEDNSLMWCDWEEYAADEGTFSGRGCKRGWIKKGE